MRHTIGTVLLGAGVLLLASGDAVRCTTTYDQAGQRYVTRCDDGSRSVTTHDAAGQRWQTRQTRPPKKGAK